MRDMKRWLGDGGMELITRIGGHFEAYGADGSGAAWVQARWEPTDLACNPHGVVQAGLHSVILDAAMNFAINASLEGSDRSQATLELKTELMRPGRSGQSLSVRGEVCRLARQIAFAQAMVKDADEQLVSRSTGTFLLHREA